MPKTDSTILAFMLAGLLALIVPARAQPEADHKLLLLAREHFSKDEGAPLASDAEDFFQAVERGQTYRNPANKGNDVADATSPAVKANYIVWLCTDPDASKLVTFHGIRIQQARIAGKIDMNGAQIPFRLEFSKCFFDDDVSLVGAHLQELQLGGCHIQALYANYAQFDGLVVLGGGLVSEGPVDLPGANLGKRLICTGGQFRKSGSHKDQVAINASGAKIAGSVFLDGVEANGEVHFGQASIDGSLNCINSHFSNSERYAIEANRVKITGAVFLRGEKGDFFEADGLVDFIGATIGGNLECTDGIFRGAEGKALSAARVKIDGKVCLDRCFLAEGEIDLGGATIGSNLDCTNGHFRKARVAINASGAKIGGALILREGFRAEGDIDLRDSEVATLKDLQQCWPNPGYLFLDGFVYKRIDNESPHTAEDRLEWLKRRPPDRQFYSQPYLQLATVFKNMGYDEDATKVLIEANHEHGKYVRGWEWWWYNVFGWVIGYGQRPGRAFLISLGVIALGYGLVKIGYLRGLMWPTESGLVEATATDGPVTPKGCVVVPKEYPRFNALIYSLEAFTPLLQLDQNAHWRPNANSGREYRFLGLSWTTGGLLRAYLWFHVIAGWVLTTLWIGAISGLVKS